MTHLTAEEARRLHDEHVAKAKENRLRHPEAAQFIDDVRAIFGSGKVVYFDEPRQDTLARLQPEPVPDGEQAETKRPGDVKV